MSYDIFSILIASKEIGMEMYVLFFDLHHIVY